MSPPKEDLSGTIIASQFRVERLLGQGGMGSVYLAEQLEMGRKVVVKVMHPANAGSAELEERFKREAQAVAQLNHPNIVQVYVFGHMSDTAMYLAMEYVPGRSLSELLAERKLLPEARALRIADQICSALIEAHAMGLVHRDLKPDNIMLTDRHGTLDFVKVLDFGIAKLMDETNARLTKTGALFGTPQYMAPEQAKGASVDQRTDLYSLGLILYEMLTGMLPFHADTPMAFLVKHMSELAIPPSKKVADLVLLPRTEAAVMKCLAKDAGDRFQSVSELQRELRLALRDRPDAARSCPTPAAPVDQPKRPELVPENKALRRLGFGLAFLFLGGLGVGIFFWTKRTPSSTSVESAPSKAVANPAGKLVAGMPAPEGAELVAAVEQAVTLRLPTEPEYVLDFYRAQVCKSWGPCKSIPNGLQFEHPKAPMLYLTVSRMGDYTQAIFMRNALVPMPKPTGDRIFFGVAIPSTMRVTVESPKAVVLQAKGPPTEHAAWFRSQFTGKPGVTFIETDVDGAPYFVASAKDDGLPYTNVAMMKTPDALKPSPGDWTQISITK
jgi:serine/threonine protein kinase